MDKTCHNDSKPTRMIPHSHHWIAEKLYLNMPISCSKDSGGIKCKAPRSRLCFFDITNLFCPKRCCKVFKWTKRVEFFYFYLTTKY